MNNTHSFQFQNTLNIKTQGIKILCLVVLICFSFALAAQNEITVTGSSSFVNIPDDDANGIDAQVFFNNIPANAILTDVEVTLAINHNNVGDLKMTLISPAGQEIVLVDRPEGNGFVEADLISTDPISFSDAFTLNNPEEMGALLDSTEVICRDDAKCEFFPFDDTANPKTFAYLLNAVNANGGPRGTWRVNIADLSEDVTGNFRVDELKLTYTTDLFQSSLSYSTNNLLTLVDNDPTGKSFVLDASNFPTLGTLNWIEVSLAINHTEAGDLRMVLQAPTGDQITLVNRPARVFSDGDFNFVEGDLDAAFPITFTDDAIYNGKSMGGGVPEPPLVPFNETICEFNNICRFYPGDDVNNTKRLSDLAAEVNNNGGAAGNWTVTLSDLSSGNVGEYRVDA
ncbi:MAG: proprotein convertase P-domain-containing protein, partial [Bacteroidota bacterium]